LPIVAASDPSAIERAAQALTAGDLVAVPTETVYGLAARADDDHAVARIFETKGRPTDHPLIVHVAGREQALPLSMCGPMAPSVWRRRSGPALSR
jgi:L-threonylcarbamoyladenylate synthase